MFCILRESSMKIWIYCSYEGSPVGFQLGYVESDQLPESGVVQLKPDSTGSLINRLFSYQGVLEAYGKAPESNTYVAIRPIAREPGDTSYLNFAFETEDEIEASCIESFLKSYRNRDRDLYHLLLPAVVENQQDYKFGLCIDAQVMIKVVKEIRNAGMGAPVSNRLYVRTRNAVEGEELPTKLHLSSVYGGRLSSIPAPEIGENWFKLACDLQTYVPNEKKKKRMSTPLKVVLVAVAILILILIVSLINHD